MELIGRLIDIVRDYLTGEFRITFGVASIPKDIDALHEKELRISLRKNTRRRSLTANAYYWVLVGKISEAVNVSQAATHNILLRRYGQLERVDGEIVTMFLPDTDEAEEKALNADTYHIKPTGHVKEGKDGKMYRAYRMLKGSSEYDTKEFSTLIEGAVSEAREMGIETLPAEELERMMQAYEINHSN